MAAENPFANFEILTDHPELGITSERRQEGYRFLLSRELGGASFAIRHVINGGRYPTDQVVYEPKTKHWASLNELYARLSETQQDVSRLFPEPFSDQYARVAVTDIPWHSPASD